jgi:hypothetical protein
MLKNPFSPRLLKKVQMQGGAPGTHPQDGCRCEAYLVRTPQRRASAPTPQMGLFQQPAKTISKPDGGRQQLLVKQRGCKGDGGPHFAFARCRFVL